MNKQTECWCDPEMPGRNPSCPTHGDSYGRRVETSSLSMLRELIEAFERFGGGASMMHPRLTIAISKARKHVEGNKKSDDYE